MKEKKKMTKKSLIVLIAVLLVIAALAVTIGLNYRAVRAGVGGIIHIIGGGEKSEGTIMIGHRGYSSKHLENTEEAFVAAAEHGSGGVETDVRITSDGELVLSHDDKYYYADGTTLPVYESTYEQLAAKPLKNEFNDNVIYICTFRRYLEICKQYNMICFIEFKGEFSDEKIAEAFELAAEVYDLKMCSLQSSTMDNLIRAHTLFPDLKIMLTYGFSQVEKKVDYRQCFEYGFDIDADYRLATKAFVKEFHDRGLQVGVWTCNTKVGLNYAYSLGVDYIESDVY